MGARRCSVTAYLGLGWSGRRRRRKKPSDHIPAVWRGLPNHTTGICAIALDPREARFVLDRGWGTVDGERYTTSQPEGWAIDMDGRVMVRLTREQE